MPEVKKILFPLEFAKISPYIVPWVESMAQQFGAELHVLHVVPSTAFMGLPYVTEIYRGDEAGLETKALQAAQEFIGKHLKGSHDVQIKAATGDPAEVIVHYVKDNGIDLIVMGTHGRHGLDRTLYGSVADKVLRASPVPVLCVNPLHEADKQ
jgi:nucleotide-binding universal stress UspA family protein